MIAGGRENNSAFTHFPAIQETAAGFFVQVQLVTGAVRRSAFAQSQS